MQSNFLVKSYYDRLERNVYLLMPVVISKVDNDRDEHWEGLILVGLQDVEEVVILKEAHGSVSNLQVDAANASDNSLEEFGYQVLNLVNFAYFKHFLQLGQEKSLFNTVCKWPVLEKTLKQGNSESSVLCQEEHRASQ
jgi:hypothetical protein